MYPTEKGSIIAVLYYYSTFTENYPTTMATLQNFEQLGGLFVLWAKLDFERTGKCRCCDGPHPLIKLDNAPDTPFCHKLCLLGGCYQTYLQNPSGANFHEFKACPRRAVCDRCGKGGHMDRDCTVPQCHFCGVIGHIRPHCPELQMSWTPLPPSYGQWLEQSSNYAPHTLEFEGTHEFPSEPLYHMTEERRVPQCWRHDPYSATGIVGC